MPRSFLNYHSAENDAIKGKRIVVEAQKISKSSGISERTSRHGGQRAKAENAEAWIERAYVSGTREL